MVIAGIAKEQEGRSSFRATAIDSATLRTSAFPAIAFGKLVRRYRNVAQRTEIETVRLRLSRAPGGVRG